MDSHTKSQYRRTMLVSFMCVLTTTYSVTYSANFLPEMTLWFGQPETDKGYYVGLIVMSCYLGSFISSYPLSWLSDQYGHRRLLLALLGVNGVGNIVFPFARTLSITLIVQFVLGMCNVMIPIARAIIPLYVEEDSCATVMTLSNVAWEIGLIVGSAIGGYLASPITKYQYFSTNEFFRKFPYALPPFVGVVLSVVTVVVVWLGYPSDDGQEYNRLWNEIKEEQKTTQDSDLMTINTNVNELSDEVSDDTHVRINEIKPIQTYGALTPTQPRDRKNYRVGVTSSTEDSIEKHQQVSSNEIVHQTYDNFMTSEKTFTKAVNAPSTFSPRETKYLEQHKGYFTHTSALSTLKSAIRTLNLALSTIKSSICKSTFVRLITDAEIMKLFLVYAVLGNMSTVYVEIFAIWASTDRDLGGLQYSTNDIGMVVIYTVGPCCVIQLLFMPRIERRLGSVNCCIMYLIIGIAAMPSVPLCRFIRDPTTQFIVIMIMQVFVTTSELGYCIATHMMVNNCVPDAQVASANGLARMITNACVTAFSPITGSIFTACVTSDIGSPVDVSLVFVFIGMCLWVSAIVAYFIPRRFCHKYVET